jgi:hypothetical protein
MYRPKLEVLEDRCTPSVTLPTFEQIPATIQPQGHSTGFTGYHLSTDPVNVSHQIGLYVSPTGLQSVVTDQVVDEANLHWVFVGHNPVQITTGDVTGASIAANPVTGQVIVTWVMPNGDVKSSESQDGGTSWDASLLVVHDISLHVTHVNWVPDNPPLPTASNPMPGPGDQGHFTVNSTNLSQEPDYAAMASVFRNFVNNHNGADGWQEV